jgi:hypothetical protein
MQLHQSPGTVFLPQPPPLWYVTNGERSVGPIVTGLLTRYVDDGQIGDACHVRMPSSRWRDLLAVREIAARHSRVGILPMNWQREAMADLLARVGRMRDEDELLHEVTEFALTTTKAESAMLHYLGRSTKAMVTRCILGPMPNDRLGYPLPESDLVLEAARFGRPVVGPTWGPTEDRLAMRFAASRGGTGAVAMIPISVGGVVTTMLEVSRPGRPFRRTDLQRAEQFAQRALRTHRN